MGAKTKFSASISIHTPRVGSDGIQVVKYYNLGKFQSTLPVWGATAKMHRFFFCIFGEKGIICNILQIGGLSAGNLLKTVGCFLSKSGANPPEKLWVLGVRV